VAAQAHLHPQPGVGVKRQDRVAGGGRVVERDDEAAVGRLHQVHRQRQGGGHDRDAAGHVLGDLGRHRVPEVLLVLQQRQTRERTLD
jgi:hypothetical protein